MLMILKDLQSLNDKVKENSLNTSNNDDAISIGEDI